MTLQDLTSVKAVRRGDACMRALELFAVLLGSVITRVVRTAIPRCNITRWERPSPYAERRIDVDYSTY